MYYLCNTAFTRPTWASNLNPLPASPGAWDGKIDQPIPQSIPPDASAIARMMREAGDAFLAALKKQGKSK